MHIISFILSLGKMSDAVNTALITIFRSQFNTACGGQKGLRLMFSIKAKVVFDQKFKLKIRPTP